MSHMCFNGMILGAACLAALPMDARAAAATGNFQSRNAAMVEMVANRLLKKHWF